MSGNVLGDLNIWDLVIWGMESWRSGDVCLEMSGDLEISGEIHWRCLEIWRFLEIWRCRKIWRYLVKYIGDVWKSGDLWRCREIWRYLVKYNQEMLDLEIWGMKDLESSRDLEMSGMLRCLEIWGVAKSWKSEQRFEDLGNLQTFNKKSIDFNRKSIDF